MKRLLALVSVIAGTAATTAAAASPTPATGGPSAVAYSDAVTRICTGALLFDHAHEIGTRAGAIAVAGDIRASTDRRLARIDALAAPPGLRQASSRWISSQRQLAASFARTWVRIFDTIAAVRTPAQRASLPQRLERLVHLPDPLKAAARRLEAELRVPDCTGGDPPARPDPANTWTTTP
jgi:hypothetical protein